MKYSRVGLIFLGHGSSDFDTQREFYLFVEAFQNSTKLLGDVYSAYLESEIQKPSLVDVLLTLPYEKVGTVTYQEVLIIPLLLFVGKHSSEDIPEIISFVKKIRPNIKLSVLNPIGQKKQVLEVLLERVREATLDMHLLGTKRKIEYIVIGRGINHKEGFEVFLKQVSKFSDSMKTKNIRYCFWAISAPQFIKTIEIIAQDPSLEVTDWIFVPYLLFDGVLYKKIINVLQQRFEKHISYYVSRPLGVHPLLLSMFEYKISNFLNGSNTLR